MNIRPRDHHGLHGRTALAGFIVMAWDRRGMLVMVLSKRLEGAVLACQQEDDAAQACQRCIQNASRGPIHVSFCTISRRYRIVKPRRISWVALDWDGSARKWLPDLANTKNFPFEGQDRLSAQG